MPLLTLALLHSQYSHTVVFPRVIFKQALTAGRLLRKIYFNYLLFSAEGVLAVGWRVVFLERFPKYPDIPLANSHHFKT